MHMESYESIEAMFAAMGQAERSANESLHPRQVALRDADEADVCWVRPEPSVGLIFGEAWSWRRQSLSALSYVPGVDWAPVVAAAVGPMVLADAASKVERPEGHDPADWAEALSEAVYSIRATAESRVRGYLFGEAWSAPFPEGELGDTHVANAWPISREAFEEARAAGWRAVHVEGPAGRVLDATARLVGGTPLLVRELEVLDEAMREARG